MYLKGLRSAFVSTVTEVEAGDKASNNTETLICYTVCCAVVHFISFSQYTYDILSLMCVQILYPHIYKSTRNHLISQSQFPNYQSCL